MVVNKKYSMSSIDKKKANKTFNQKWPMKSS